MYNLKKVINNQTVLVLLEDKSGSYKIDTYEKIIFWDNFTDKFVMYNKRLNCFNVITDIDFMEYKPIAVNIESLIGNSTELADLNTIYLDYLLKKYKIEKLLDYDRPNNENIKKLDDIINILEDNVDKD